MGQNARATTQEGRRCPSTVQVAANKTNREGPRIRIRGVNRGSPKEPQQRSQSTTQRLPQHRSTRREKTTLPGQETLRPHRNSTARQRQRHHRANRAYRRNAPRQDTQTAVDRTRSDSKRTPKRSNRRRQRPAQTNHQGHGRSAPTRAGTRAKTGHEEGTRQHKANDRRDARRRLGDHQRTEDRHGNRSRKAHPSARTDDARRTTSTGNTAEQRHKV
jgi:hypothetical protein